jgi:hypothetical protein
MKKETQKPMKRASSQEVEDQRKNKCERRLSKTLPGGKTEPPGTRGDCEKETSVQGSE